MTRVTGAIFNLQGGRRPDCSYDIKPLHATLAAIPLVPIPLKLREGGLCADQRRVTDRAGRPGVAVSANSDPSARTSMLTCCGSPGVTFATLRRRATNPHGTRAPARCD
jgi:hypothetical protein